MEITDLVKFALVHGKYNISMKKHNSSENAGFSMKFALFTESPLQNQQNSAVIVYVSGQRSREGDFYQKYQKF